MAGNGSQGGEHSHGRSPPVPVLSPNEEPDPESVQWVFDYIPHYRLNPNIITNFLKTKWNDYDEFFVEASTLRPVICSLPPTQAELSQKVGNQYQFWVPRKLRKRLKLYKMNHLILMCNEGIHYPANLPERAYPKHILTSFSELLDQHGQRLFSNEQESEVTFRDLDFDGEGLSKHATLVRCELMVPLDPAFWNVTVCSLERLRSHIGIDPVEKQPDPKCRFLFVHAPHSRAKLRTSREMFMQSLTYLQVIPQFLDLLFPLGDREITQDFYSDSFYQQTSLCNASRGLYIPELAWSGFEFKLCYSLKSVERSKPQTDWPWSVRHCAVYHSFDTASVRSNWIVVKGNKLMEERITSATSGRGPSEFSSYGTIEDAFASALATHLIMVDWSAENWRWYINFLEDQFEQLTEGIVSKNADVPTSAMEVEDAVAMVSRTNTQMSRPSPTVRSFSKKLFHASSRRADTAPTVTEMQPSPAQQYHTNPRSGKRQPLPPGKTIVAGQPSNKPMVEYDTYGQKQFNFRHLQQVQSLEESANATVLVLKSNQNICEQIRTFYRSLLDNHELSGTEIEPSCQKDLARFERRILGAARQMSSQVLRVKAFLRLIADRKTLVRSSIFALHAMHSVAVS
ncbi:MAG: hypothetical protein Q9201_000691 [Fulgogasparrea decipioides]